MHIVFLLVSAVFSERFFIKTRSKGTVAPCPKPTVTDRLSVSTREVRMPIEDTDQLPDDSPFRILQPFQLSDGLGGLKQKWC